MGKLFFCKHSSIDNKDDDEEINDHDHDDKVMLMIH